MLSVAAQMRLCVHMTLHMAYGIWHGFWHLASGIWHPQPDSVLCSDLWAPDPVLNLARNPSLIWHMAIALGRSPADSQARLAFALSRNGNHVQVCVH